MIPRNRPFSLSWFGATPLALALALALTGCGEDPDDGHDGHDHTHEDGGDPDAGGYEFVPCDPNLPPLVVGFEQLGMERLIKAKVVSVDPLPLLRGSADFVIDFTTADGQPVADIVLDRARVYMPVHQHPGPGTPQISSLPEPGRQRIDNFNFNMRGPWVVQLTVSSPSVGADYMVFDVCVEPEL
jgi:hypothetical protein